MTGEMTYLDEEALAIIEDVQDDIEDKYGFRPKPSDVIRHLAEPEGSPRRRS